MISVIMFDILDSSYTTELIFDFDEDYQRILSKKILDQVKDLGYETHNSWLILGSIAIFLVVYLVQLILWITVLTPLSYYTYRFSTWRKIRDKLFFINLISLTLESYLVMILSCVFTL
jgi:hypothetical protein